MSEVAKYTPSDWRFQISKDPISRERYKALKEIYSELKLEFPEIPITFGLFGSLSKGRALTQETAKDADIDLLVHYDMDALEEFHRTHAYKDQPWYKPLNKDPQDAFETHLARTIRDKLWQKIQVDFKMTSGVVVTKISKKPESQYSIFNFAERKTREHVTKSAAIIVATYFALDIGGGMQPYIQDFIRHLHTLPKEEAERIWGNVNYDVRISERDGNVPARAQHQFPDTFEKALKHYKVA